MDDDRELLAISTSEDVDRWARRMFDAPLSNTGLLHVTSAWQQSPGKLRTLLIRPGVPSSQADFFSLNLARARADAIITTGRILREEPELSHQLQGPGALPSALAAWRQDRLSKRTPPVTLVLSSGDVDLDHPLFAGPGRTIVYTGREGQWQLESSAMDRGIEIVAADSPSPAGAVELLRSQFGAATISIEAGPSVARRFYEPLEVDELLLSIYSSPELDSRFIGPSQLSLGHLRELFPRRSQPYRQGHWEFMRFTRH